MNPTIRFLSYFSTLLMAIFLAACGGGGGSAGTTSGSVPVVPVPTVQSPDTRLSAQLKDSTGATIQSIPFATGAEVVATLTNTEGAPLANQIVNVAESSSIAFLPNGNTATTDSKGVARIKVNRRTGTKFGSGILSIKFEGFVCATKPCAGLLTTLSSSSSSIDFRVDPPSFKLELLDAANAATNSIGSSGFTSVKATLKFEDGTPVSQKRVNITAVDVVAGDPVKVVFPEGSSQLTNASGVAIIKIARSPSNSNGAGTLKADATISGPDSTGFVDTTVVTGLIDFTVGIANIALTELNVGTTPLVAFGTRLVSVKATINGVAATNTSVPITFNASCGTVSPAVVTTDASGVATTTYTASQASCAGANVSISASAVGATQISKTIAVANSVATNVQFVSATPQLIYLKDSVGTTQAQIVFKAVDSSGKPLQSKKLRLSLSNTSTGISLNTLGSTDPVDLTTDELGLVSTAVFSGTVPTSLNVKATLLDDNNVATGVFANSNILTVASGRPTQRSLSLSLGKLSLEGRDVDGESTTVTLAMADRQGNPVPPGTQVNFVAESGVLLPASCVVPPVVAATSTSAAIPSSSCTVTIKSSGTRTANGRVSILAFTAGEEDFVDVNGNNIYDSGEPFTDLGRAFRDDNGQAAGGANGRYDSGEFQVPRELTSACTPAGCVGDGVWGVADVRKQATIVFASSTALISATTSLSGVNARISDINGNSVPTGSTVKATVVDRTSGTPNDVTCTLVGADSIIVPNTLLPINPNFGVKDCSSGDLITITVTTPLGLITSRDFVF